MSNRAFTDPHAVLGLPSTASKDDVKAAFRRLALKVGTHLCRQCTASNQAGRSRRLAPLTSAPPFRPCATTAPGAPRRGPQPAGSSPLPGGQARGRCAAAQRGEARLLLWAWLTSAALPALTPTTCSLLLISPRPNSAAARSGTGTQQRTRRVEQLRACGARGGSDSARLAAQIAARCAVGLCYHASGRFRRLLHCADQVSERASADGGSRSGVWLAGGVEGRTPQCRRRLRLLQAGKRTLTALSAPAAAATTGSTAATHGSRRQRWMSGCTTRARAASSWCS